MLQKIKNVTKSLESVRNIKYKSCKHNVTIKKRKLNKTAKALTVGDLNVT